MKTLYEILATLITIAFCAFRRCRLSLAAIRGVVTAMNYRDDKLFNVQIDGSIVVAGITREAAQVYLDARTSKQSVFVYLQDRPLIGRKKPRLSPSIPRLPSLRVSEATRGKLRAALLADGTMTEEGET